MGTRARTAWGVRKMEKGSAPKFLDTMARYVFRDYSLSAASLVTMQ